MSANRVRVAKDKAEFMRGLLDSAGTTGPFQTYADAIAFAAALGVERGKRVPLGAISTREPGPIGLEVFISRGYDRAIQLIAIAQTQNPHVISPYDRLAEEERIEIFEEFANGGLAILQDELRGAVDYSERLLLMLNRDRFQEEVIEEEFDLSRFL
ncbi:DNA phosphorothioation-associated protein 4 [Lusitaniella coriacea LEGE 07157]|uniref:DNA phosphorothioation-associated protein 4 n=1 Tax=Lusitaniella coriacea LEGE 07157 TaxID=945747 RepID=A0A8J7ITY8_9CYAN|nr:DNA phosphorothioation-associated protein 4 [Lusitaniella coriacea]MBE9116158.1 DNA phosphorothioation-associated protein 4 [Lusitaniella coriacea LEGE 07157]